MAHGDKIQAHHTSTNRKDERMKQDIAGSKPRCKQTTKGNKIKKQLKENACTSFCIVLNSNVDGLPSNLLKSYTHQLKYLYGIILLIALKNTESTQTNQQSTGSQGETLRKFYSFESTPFLPRASPGVRRVQYKQNRLLKMTSRYIRFL